ncbi:hypothetical protein MPTK1_6g15840 [Marchantia polymorpha subsp. ruderalis]|uniref:Uncharacterized protein n=2 Tax=Marchantia polymorpha TaxID=3197 RepID=A0AAF6BSH8_MARPO|nr:hypothetical protein MARPO_0056s0096 [Marchantia polymorpha]BBN14962.1 hypothetical protein Mp_6g15840 [Marchantia polymorpha subsp. ruderalis]|eukprot:PTQ37646.1 hypothetical protein MARPO_0056s0096 [Marchantia polymorpha]
MCSSQMDCFRASTLPTQGSLRVNFEPHGTLRCAACTWSYMDKFKDYISGGWNVVLDCQRTRLNLLQDASSSSLEIARREKGRSLLQCWLRR